MTPSMQKTFPVKTELLEFDRHNPRLVLTNGSEQATDTEIIKTLIREADIGELIESIVANNYMDIEPLIVTQKNVQKAGNYRVLEGNRRLSAIRLLQNQNLARDCRLSLPKDIPEKVYASLQQVTVYLVEDDIESRAFIGFKHINGAHRWDSYAKARFLTEWYLDETENGITVEKIAQQLGDKNQTVRNLIAGMLVLQQAEQEELFEISDRTKSGQFGFSHLYTALGRIEYRNFLGLEKGWDQQPTKSPVPTAHKERLKEVLQYIYGSKQAAIQSVIESQNPDIKKLGEVLAAPMAMETLRVTKSLKIAYEEVLPASDVFRDTLIIANTRVQEVLGKSSKFSVDDGDTLLPIAKTMLENADNIVSLMERKILREPK
jgi:hypothetical protein